MKPFKEKHLDGNHVDQMRAGANHSRLRKLLVGFVFVSILLVIGLESTGIRIYGVWNESHVLPESFREPMNSVLLWIQDCTIVPFMGSMIDDSEIIAQPEQAEYSSAHESPVKLTNKFQLKHIYHRGTGPENYKVHRRLDITPEYLKKHEAYFDSMVDSLHKRDDVENDEDLDEIYRQLDWPKVHAATNPFSIQLPVKTATKPGKSVRLKERHKPGFLDSYLSYAMQVKGNAKILNRINLEWEDETDIPIPDVGDRDSLISLATISSNAYVRYPQSDDEKNKLDWIDVGGWNPDEDNGEIEYGWDDVGLRGHVFVSEDNKTVIIGIKGTSGAALPGGGSEETAPSDKTNDNLLFSCCCARVGYMWTTVCDCYEKTYTCNQDCLERELVRKDRYYQATLDLYRNVSAIYSPETTDIWVTGHSLGGALASLLGRTYGLPTVAFESPGEMLATKRLHLPQPPGLPRHMENIWHIGHTADPIYMGVCNGASSSCNIAGYAMETACHTGKQCVYDVVTDMGWRVNLLHHRIHTVIDDIIMVYNRTATCIQQPPCRDCFNWRFTSHDDDEGDEPFLPNPLKPKKPKSSTIESNTRSYNSTSTYSKPTCTTVKSSTTKPTKTSTTTPTDTSEPEKPQKCLKRTWYGWCTEWGDDDSI